MQAAPQVLYPLGSDRVWRLGAGLLLLCSLAFMAVVAVTHPDGRLVAAMGVLMLPGVWLLVNARPRRDMQLAWDGECWHLLGSRPFSGQLLLVLDLQQALLLRWSPPFPESAPDNLWLWIEKDANPVIWMDVRRAVYWNAH